jgi:hypothetical protein
MIYNSNNLYANNTNLKGIVINSHDKMSFETLCTDLKIGEITNSVRDAKLFPVNIMLLVQFAGIVDFNLLITKKIKKKINSGKAKLILNHWHEAVHYHSDNYFKSVFNKIYDKLELARINTNNVAFMSGDMRIEESFKNDPKFNVIGIDSFEFIYNKWMGDGVFKIPDITFSLDKEKDFLFLNSRPREHRCILRYYLNKNNLLDRSINSWVPGSQKPFLPAIEDYLEKHNFDFNAQEIYNFGLEEKRLDVVQERLIAQGFQNRIPQEWLDKTVFSFITETRYESHLLFLTEKTYKVMLYGQPFMIYGNSGTLKYLRKNGYETFSEMFDESYDTQNEKMKYEIFKKNILTFRDRVNGNEGIIREKLEHNRNRFLKQPSSTVTKNKLFGLLDDIDI